MAPNYLEYFESLFDSVPAERRQSSILAIRTLVDCLQQTNPNTMTEFLAELQDAENQLCQSSLCSAVSTRAGCDALRRFMSLTRTEALEGAGFRNILLGKGKKYLNAVESYRSVISSYAEKLIEDGHTIMIHSNSSAVLNVIIHACKFRKIKTLYVTRCDYDDSGTIMVDWIRKRLGPQFTKKHVVLINDTCVAPIMQSTNLIILGAEVVTPDGGIINRVGTLNIAICAAAYCVPVYVLAETFKFVKYMPNNTKNEWRTSKTKANCLKLSLDYTPGRFITSIITDIGVLTPQSVSEEIVKLYK
ncbi:hypothetical protein GJ496_002990 [Pomphorhynchus laevis]|nr:hypothetical protein GJ496_002990 [Pomphorhynchus laevis]